jgi:nuclear pore complex protein Nup62
MVESVNCLNLSPGPSHSSGIADEGSRDDAISTIAGILNAHLSSLQWIDGSLKEMEGKVNDVERKIKDKGARGWSNSDTGEGANKGRSYGLGTSRR